MKIQLLVSFFAIGVVNGMSAMICSGDMAFPQLKPSERSIFVNSAGQLVVRKKCRDKEIFEQDCTNDIDMIDGERITTVTLGKKEKVQKKEIDEKLLDNDGNLIIAQWFASKKQWNSQEPLSFTESVLPSQEEAECTDNQIDKWRANCKNDFEISKKCLNPPGMWYYFRDMKLIEMIFGVREEKVEAQRRIHSMFVMKLSNKGTGECNFLGKHKRIVLPLTGNKYLQEPYEKLFNDEERAYETNNCIAFERSSMKKSEFDLYQRCRKDLITAGKVKA